MLKTFFNLFSRTRHNTRLPEHILMQKRTARRVIAAIMFYSGYTKRLRRKVAETGLPSWRILSYPHIVNPEELPFPIPFDAYVRPKTFESNLRFLSKHFRIIPLAQLLEKINKGEKVDADTVCITFDCCWCDTHVYAFPLLHQYRIPATVFVPTSYPNSYNMFWQDTLRFVMVTLMNVNHTFPKLPELGDEFAEWVAQLDEGYQINEHNIALLIDCLEYAEPTIRYTVYQKIIDQVHLYGELPQFSAFANWDEIREMTQSKLVSIGSHGHGYKFLSELSREELANDMRQAVQKLRDENIEPLEVLSLPNGRYDMGLLISLGAMGLRFALGQSVGVDIDPSKHGTLLLERVPVDEACASSNSIFASRLLAVPIPTQLYLGKQ